MFCQMNNNLCMVCALVDRDQEAKHVSLSWASVGFNHACSTNLVIHPKD